MLPSRLYSSLAITILALIALAMVSLQAEADDAYLLNADFNEAVAHMRDFATPTHTVPIPSAPTGFDEEFCRAHPDICINAGLLPHPTA